MKVLFLSSFFHPNDDIKTFCDFAKWNLSCVKNVCYFFTLSAMMQKKCNNWMTNRSIEQDEEKEWENWKFLKAFWQFTVTVWRECQSTKKYEKHKQNFSHLIWNGKMMLDGCLYNQLRCAQERESKNMEVWRSKKTFSFSPRPSSTWLHFSSPKRARRTNKTRMANSGVSLSPSVNTPIE